MKVNPTSTFLDGWRTARVSAMCHASLCIGRLQDRAIDHHVLREEDRVRIVVRRADLHDAIELLRDIAAPRSAQVIDRTDQRLALQVLIGIPAGSIAGAFIGTLLGADTIPWSVGGAVYMSSLLGAINSRHTHRPAPTRGHANFWQSPNR